MKKILLIPTVLTIVSVPAISLAACSSLQDPEPSYDPYVTDEEMLSAITLLNDEYVQLQGELFKNGNRTDIINKCSPSISYELEKTESKYRENFIVKNYDSATSISRNSIDSEWSISETVCDKFLMPQDLSENYLLESYLIAYTYEKEFEFDNNKKCYTISAHDLSLDYGANLYFYDKKLIKLEFLYFDGTSQWVGSFNLSYDKDPLQLPHNPKLNDEQLATEMKEAIELSGIKIAQVHYEEHILEETSIVDYEYSPFIYHMMGTKGETSPNLYVVNNDDTSYTKIFPSPEDPTQ
ncbi:MAG: hypothetical protein MJ200_01045 [Mycoplasmoidaceae bacterium]|nr:hypothetical protein [Mycoplasmoidaceae bacterium]